MDADVWRWLWSMSAIMLALGGLSLGGFVLLPFAFGAAASAILAWIGVGLLAQWLVFFAVSLLALAFMRRFIRRQDEGDSPRVGSNRWIGSRGVVLEEIDPHAGQGMVKVLNEDWSASAATRIPAGARVVVVDVRGTRVIVEQLEESNE